MSDFGSPLDWLFCGRVLPLARLVDKALASLTMRDHEKVQQTEASFKNLVLGILIADVHAERYKIDSKVRIPQRDGSNGYADLIITRTTKAPSRSAVVVLELKYPPTHYCCLQAVDGWMLSPGAAAEDVAARNKNIQTKLETSNEPTRCFSTNRTTTEVS